MQTDFATRPVYTSHLPNKAELEITGILNANRLRLADTISAAARRRGVTPERLISSDMHWNALEEGSFMGYVFDPTNQRIECKILVTTSARHHDDSAHIIVDDEPPQVTSIGIMPEARLLFGRVPRR